ncbi:MAG: hypothetical protein ACXVH7_01520, partial [Thermoanaerobaculia bacterium]
MREAGVFLFFLVLAIILTWPLTRSISRTVSDLGDPLLNAWILDWDCYALTHAPLHLYDAPIYAPGKYPLAYSENMVGIAVLILPFWLAGVGPITLYNLAMLFGFALSGYGMFVLARRIVGSFPGAIAAGIFFAFAPFKFDHLSHVQIIFSGWLPLMFAALLAFWKTPARSRALWLAIAFVMNGLTNVHYLLFGSLTLGLTVMFLALVERRSDRKFWAMLAAALIGGSLVLLPFLIPYHIVSAEYGMKRGVGETLGGSATWNDWLVASPVSRWYGHLAKESNPERHLFTGLVPLFLAGVGFFLRRREVPYAAPELPPATARQRTLLRWIDGTMIVAAFVAYFGMVTKNVEWTVNGQRILSLGTAAFPLTVIAIAAIVRFSIRLPRALSPREERSARTIVRRSRFSYEEWCATLWIVIGVLGSFGLNAFFHQFLYRYITVFQSIRAPARWAVIAYIGVAVWMAIGIEEILRRRSRQWSALAAVFVFLAFADVAVLVRWAWTAVEPEPMYRWLVAERVPGPVLELPMSDNGVQYLYLLGSTAHHVPIMNGISGFEPPVHEQLRMKGEASEFDDAYMRLVEQSGGTIVVVHADWLRVQVNGAFRWLERNLAAGRLVFLRRFDHGTNGDWVFAVTRNVRDWKRLQAPEVPDRAGFTPGQNLARLFAKQHTFNESAFGYIDTPKSWTEVRGPLQIVGWALSPKGVKRVIVHLDNNRRQVDAELYERPDISSYFG